MKKKLNLAQQSNEPTEAAPDAAEDTFPTLSIQDHPDPAIMSIPDSGQSVIQHKVIHRSENIGKNGKKLHSVTLQVHSIEPSKGSGHFPKHSRLPGIKEDEAAVDKGLK
jgi:hypothetical protein